MTEFEACKAVLESYRDKYDGMHAELLVEYRLLKEDGWPKETLDDVCKEETRAAVRLNLLNDILSDLDDKVQERLQEYAMTGE